MAIFKCKMCGGALEIATGASVIECEYCGTQQTLPKLDDDRRANMYDRANHFRRNNEFDKAMGIYENILNEDSSDAEAYWSLVLCRYGIEYVEDPSSHKRIPTINRAQFTSIFDDNNYKSAIQYADSHQKALYEAEANAINEIQKGILAISQKEEPFDVFICYKETDHNGRRTPDSVLANDLYHQLTQEGFKVFFSRITLEDKLGSAYEPYIFAALNSAKVMVVLGTKAEYFSAVWVKNEWSRYLALVKRSGGKKVLIPAYRDMDPYDLPEEFSHLQAQDMSKLGFMQDLIRGIKKITQTDTPAATVVKETVVTGGSVGNTVALLKRGFMALEDGEWNKADGFFEEVLNQDAECAEAYLGKLMAELKVRLQDDLKNCTKPFDTNGNYQKVLRFGNAELRAALEGYIKHIENTLLADIYSQAKDKLEKAKNKKECLDAAELFNSILDYKDSADFVQKCKEKPEILRKDALLQEGRDSLGKGSYKAWKVALACFEAIPGWKNADNLAQECRNNIAEHEAKLDAERLEIERRAEIAQKKAKKIKIITRWIAAIVVIIIAVFALNKFVIIPNSKYNDAVALMEKGQYEDALVQFAEIGGYKDAKSRYAEALNAIARRHSVAAGSSHTVAVKDNGTVVAVGNNKYGQCDVSTWTDIVEVAAGSSHTVGLKSDGTVIAVGYDKFGQCMASGWTDIVAIAAGAYHTVGLKADGTVVAAGDNGDGQCKVYEWTNIVAIAAGTEHTVGLKADGTVVAVGNSIDGRCRVSGWKGIVAVAAGHYHTVGLKADGTVVTVGDNSSNQRSVSGWKDIVAVAAGEKHTVGLRSDGTVVAAGYNIAKQSNLTDWENIVAVATGSFHIVGLKSNGTVVAVGYDGPQCNVSTFKNIKTPN